MKKRVHPRSLKNLRSWGKGHSGNPGGRPKTVMSDASRDWLKQIDPKMGKTNAELVAQALGKKALKGETAAFCALRDTTEGRPTQAISGPGGDPIPVTIEGIDEALMKLIAAAQERQSRAK
jgi:Family of unknown function (DUF5681)